MNKLKPFLLIFLIVTLPISFAYQITYDANGNVEWTEKDNLFRQYDALNRLRYIRNGTNSNAPLLQEIIFHPIEERVWIKKNYNSSGDVFETFYYLSKKFMRKVNSSGSYDYTYIYLDDGSLVAQINPDNSTLYFLNDNIGSNTIVTNASGDLVERNFYAPFGAPLDNNPSSDRLYENKEYDKLTKTYDFNFRMFNGENGPHIFLQPDDRIPNPYNPQYLNRYMFELGNPWKNIDPSGHSSIGKLTLGIVPDLIIIDNLQTLININEDITLERELLRAKSDALKGIIPGLVFAFGMGKAFGASGKLGTEAGLGLKGIKQLGEFTRRVALANPFEFKTYLDRQVEIGGFLTDFQKTMFYTRGGVNLLQLTSSLSLLKLYRGSNYKSVERSMQTTAMSGKNINWYYNQITESYTWRVGDAPPSGEGWVDTGSSGSSSGSGSGTCRATGNARCPE